MSNANCPDTSRTGQCLLDGRPDWNIIPFDVTCSRCGYNLRGLSEPRCPECGLTFAWPEMLDRFGHHNEFLFEHTWRKRPVRSYLRTMFHGLFPRRFWERVSIHDRIHPGALLFLLLCSAAVVALMGPIPTALRIVNRYLVVSALPPGAGGWAAGRVQRILFAFSTHQLSAGSFLDVVYLRPLMYLRDLPTMLLFGPILQLLVMLGMVCSLRQTLGRRRVRTVQVLRVVACLAPPVCLLWCLLTVGYMVSVSWTADSRVARVSDPGFADVICLAMGMETLATPAYAAFTAALLLLFFAIPMLYLRAGLSRYLHLPHATSICVATFVVTALVVPTLFVLLARAIG